MAVLLPGLTLGLLYGAVSDRPVLLSALVGMLVSWGAALALDAVAWHRLTRK